MNDITPEPRPTNVSPERAASTNSKPENGIVAASSMPASPYTASGFNETPPAVMTEAPRPRVWPGVAIIVLMWLAMTVPPWIAPFSDAHFYGVFFGPMIGAGLIGLWWLFGSRVRRPSRVRWRDKFLVLGAFAAVVVATYYLSDPTMKTFGGMPLIMSGLPIAVTAAVLWLLATPFLRWPTRRAGLLLAFVLVGVLCDSVRWGGVDAFFRSSWQFRWSNTAEASFMAQLDTKVVNSDSAQPMVLQEGDWPAFRGPNRDSRLKGVSIATNWNEAPPRELWRHRVGPGWSSFAVVGDRAYTQEQWDKDEVVVCYDANTGVKHWFHKDACRFEESIAGAGPRSTPTFHDGKIYALGATGLLNCLDGASGDLVWSRDIHEDSGAAVPMWGFSSSPLIVKGLVTVFAGAKGKSVLAYDAATGKPAWQAGDGTLSYCSTQLARLGGVEQLLMPTELGLTSFDPATGKVLWQHDWPAGRSMRVIQPAVLDGSDLVFGSTMGDGTRRVHVRHDGEKWSTEEVWSTNKFNPYFNDMVVHDGHLYGFDNAFFACVSLDEGKKKWSTRDYGGGQVLLLADQGLLLVLSETGEVALVEASPDKLKELCRFKALDGKTWNHPVIAHGKLFVRNGEEAACFQLKEVAKH